LANVTSNLPIFGKLRYKLGLARFSRSFYVLLSSGVNFLKALDISANVSGNEDIQKALKLTARAISQGKGFSQSLRKGGVFLHIFHSRSGEHFKSP